MKKQFLSLGKVLNKTEQKNTLGGNAPAIVCPDDNYTCDTGRCNYFGHCY